MESETSSKCDEQSSNAAVALVFIGISVIAICFMWPVPQYYVIDPKLSAADNEANQLALNRKQTILYAMTYLGMAMVTIGGVITAGLMTKSLLYEECGTDSADDEYKTLKKNPTSKNGAQSMEMQAASQSDNTNLVGADYLAMNAANQGKSYGAVNATTNGAAGTAE